MARAKTIEYPNVSLDEAIQAVTTLIEKLDGEAKNVDAFASMIGHASGKSGTFLLKLGDIRRYGLIEARGEVKATPLAKTLVHPLNEQERQDSVNKAIMNVELWRQLYQKIGKNYPADDQFWVYIMEVTSCDRNDAIKEADRIRKKYKEVMTLYKEVGSSSPIPPKEGETNNTSGSNQKPRNPNMTEIRFEEISISFPKGDLEAAETAKELIEMQIKKLKKPTASE